jgi:hypothetical protein
MIKKYLIVFSMKFFIAILLLSFIKGSARG